MIPKEARDKIKAANLSNVVRKVKAGKTLTKAELELIDREAEPTPPPPPPPAPNESGVVTNPERAGEPPPDPAALAVQLLLQSSPSPSPELLLAGATLEVYRAALLAGDFAAALKAIQMLKDTAKNKPAATMTIDL